MQQNAIHEKLTELAKREVEVYRTAFENRSRIEADPTEVGKPKSNWEINLGTMVKY